MIYRYGSQFFLGLATLAFLGWLYTRFLGPIFGVSYEGFWMLTSLSLTFVIAVSLVQLAFEKKKD